MKQFNLPEYLANPSRQVVTRDGKVWDRNTGELLRNTEGIEYVSKDRRSHNNQFRASFGNF